MFRDKWMFPYTADTLHAAATEKHKFHTGRLEWWNKKKEDVMNQIRAHGLEIDESVAIGYSNSGRNASVSVRDDLLRDLNECVAKVNEHTSKVKDYDAWIQVLKSQGQSSFNLNQDDWLFFFVK